MRNTAREAAAALLDAGRQMALESERLEDAGLWPAAAAARDQAEAYDRDARQIAEESGDGLLISLWPED